jgi:hypothetical protein
MAESVVGILAPKSFPSHAMKSLFALPSAPSWSKPIHWRLWVALSVVLPGSAVLWASTQLLWLPDLPNCWVISWADASSSTRLYCARELGNRQTPEDLRQGIRLVNGIPMDDPLRKEGDRLIDQLSETTLRLAEAAYQEGDLNAAVDIAKKIPRGIWTYRLASRNIRHWQTTWAKAESIYEKAEKQIDQRQWYTVLTLGRGLLSLDNRYWAETKYPELMRSLQFAKESTEWQVSTTDVQKLKPEATNTLLNQHQQKQDTEAKTHLQKAQSLAQSHDPKALRDGITEAESVLYGTPHYEAAQALVDQLQQQVETLENQPRLDRATELARKGDPDSLQAAIDEANHITWGSALYDQANERIDQWRTQMTQAETQARTEQLRSLPGSDPEIIPVSIPTPLPESESLPLPTLSPAPSPHYDLDEPIVIEVEMATPVSPTP